MDVTGQALHDWLLDNRPADADHDPVTCTYCTKAASVEEEDVTEQAIFTQEQHEQLLASAVEKAIVEAKAEADGEVLSLNERLEESELALAEKDKKIVELESAITAREERDQLDALADERVEKVQAVAHFSDEQIEARKETWAKMEEEDFGAYLEDIQAVSASAKKEHKEGEDPPKTSFDGTRATAGSESTEVDVIERFFSEGLSVAAQS